MTPPSTGPNVARRVAFPQIEWRLIMYRIDEDVRPFPSREALLPWLTAGIRAPSADNVHHVRFRIVGDECNGAGEPRVVEMRVDDAYVRCAQTHQRRLMQLSFGAVAENLRLGLGAVYRTFEPHWFPDSTDPSLALSIDLRRLERVDAPDPLGRAIETRHTNRRLFRGPPMSAAESTTLAASVVDPGIALHWLDSPVERRALLALMRCAETLRFADQALHAELFESIDWTLGWHAAASERLSPATLEVERPLRGVFSALRYWPLTSAVNRVGAARMLGFRAGDLPARLAPHIGVIASRGERNSALRAGAQFQRIWLAAEGAGLALQPMVASAVLNALDGAGPARARARERLQSGWRSLLGDAVPLVVFRLGRASRPSVVSARRPVSDYLID